MVSGVMVSGVMVSDVMVSDVMVSDVIVSGVFLQVYLRRPKCKCPAAWKCPGSKSKGFCHRILRYAFDTHLYSEKKLL